MRRLLLALVVVGLLAAIGRRRRLATSNSLLQEDPRADELKRKLAEAREAAADRDEFEGAETPVDRVDASVQERRRDVHEAGRAALEARGRSEP